jgi:hypothetical protein
VLNGTANQTVLTNAQSFNHLTLNNTGTNGTADNIIISGTLDVNGTLTITDGDLDIGTNNPAVNTAGAVSIASAGSIDVTGRTANWTFDGTSTLTDASSAGPQDLEDVVLNGTSLSLGSNVKVKTMTITAGTLDLGSSGMSWCGTAPLSNSGTFCAGNNGQILQFGALPALRSHTITCTGFDECCGYLLTDRQSYGGNA